MLSINTNLSSLIAQNSMKTSTDKLNQAIERMTTGFKINHAKDNAANYSISTDMTTKIGAYQVAEDNCAQGLDMITTASESLSLIQDKLERLRALATQASNGTYGAQSLKAINAEANALVDEIERQYNTTEYNGINLAKGKVISTEESKFIKDIDRRDTSKMTTLASVDPTEKLEYGTYSISTADELAKLATMTNNGLIGASTEFVLANNIDLQAWCDANSATGGWVPIGKIANAFQAVFDGNGYIISNMEINRSGSSFQGLFGYVKNAIISNLGLEDAVVKGYKYEGALIGEILDGSIVDNCFAINVNIEGYEHTGGVAGAVANATIKNSYSTGTVIGEYRFTGGFVGGDYYSSIIENSYSECDVTAGANYVGGFVGYLCSDLINDPNIVNNCFSTGNVYAETIYFTAAGNFIGVVEGNSGCYYLKDCYSTGKLFDKGIECERFALIGSNIFSILMENCNLYLDGSRPDFTIENNGKVSNSDVSLNLQVGVNSDTNSQIGMSIGYVLNNLNAFRNIGKSQFDYVSLIDKVMSSLSSKQTEYGAVQNRLESALDEISIKYENLVSSRSTLRDADIAKVSSTYIQQQILQQASATLMATANQSPAIALQLI